MEKTDLPHNVIIKPAPLRFEGLNCSYYLEFLSESVYKLVDYCMEFNKEFKLVFDSHSYFELSAVIV